MIPLLSESGFSLIIIRVFSGPSLEGFPMGVYPTTGAAENGTSRLSVSHAHTHTHTCTHSAGQGQTGGGRQGSAQPSFSRLSRDETLAQSL
jgi:hypothetical protein